MRNSLLALCAALVAIPAVAQNADRALSAPKEVSLSGLSSRVKPNARLYVRTTSGEEIEGRFSRASDDSLTLVIRGQVQEIPVSVVREVSRRKNQVRKGMLIGVIAGAAVGIIAVAANRSASDWSASESVTAGALAGGGTGLVWGAIIGAFIHRYPVVYRAPAPTVRLAPVFAPGRAGVFLVAGF